MKNRNLFAAMVAALALLGCNDEAFYSMDPEEPAAILIEEEWTRADLLADYRQWRDYLAILNGPGGSDLARKWGMTLPQAKAQAREAIRFFSATLGPWPQNAEASNVVGSTDSDEKCIATWWDRPPGGGNGEDDDDSVPPEEGPGETCWWYHYGDHDCGWWVCEREVVN